jgi:uncharacterized protein (TIGR03435 family)
MAVLSYAQPPATEFAVASVKLYKDDGVDRNSHNSYGPQGIDFRCSLGFAIGEAYSFPVGRIVGPESLTKETWWRALAQDYVIVAKSAEPASKDQLRVMLQSLLVSRFKLALHREAKTSPVYKLVVAKDGPRLEESKSDRGFSLLVSSNGFEFNNAEMIRLSGFLSGRVNRIVIDQTGLTGLYNFLLMKPEDLREGPGVKSEGISAESQSPGTFANSLKRLGLQLLPGIAPVDYLVVDHIERPSEN